MKIKYVKEMFLYNVLKVQWKPLNEVTDNVINWLVLSVLKSPGHIGKSSNKMCLL